MLELLRELVLSNPVYAALFVIAFTIGGVLFSAWNNWRLASRLLSAVRKGARWLVGNKVDDSAIVEIDGTEQTLGEWKAEFCRIKHTVKDAIETEGQIWKLPLKERGPAGHDSGGRARIISLVNLKGGVGKSTIAAHLGAAL